MATSSQGSSHDKLLDDYDKQAKLVAALNNARDALAHDGGSTDPTRIAQVLLPERKSGWRYSLQHMDFLGISLVDHFL